MMMQVFLGTIRRHMWAVRTAILLAVLVGACKEIPVDNGTANVIKRLRDTVVSHDITVERDTTIRLDTIITVDHDTLFKRDTIIDTKTIIRTDTVFSRDTVIQKDTLRVRDTVSHIDTLHIKGDTLRLHDTLHLRDTLRLHDTLRHVDTLTRHDTIIHVDTVRQVSYELPRSGVLYRKHDNLQIDSVPVDIDDLTRLIIDLQGSSVMAVQLKLLARITVEYDTAKWAAVAPSWLYMIATRFELSGGKGKISLTADPWNTTTTAGIAVVPRAPFSRQWIAIGRPPGSEGIFAVTNVDASGRWIYGYIKARFPENSAVIDSLALKFRY
jgi:hypothetical protein